MSGPKPTVLVCLDYYLPGYKAGGPIRTISNLVYCLGDEINFRIVTRDHDLGDREPYKDINPNLGWLNVGKAQVRYLRGKVKLLVNLYGTLTSKDIDTVYINSFFSVYFSMFPILCRKLGAIKGRSFIVAPRGEFSEGALSIGSLKKKLYLLFSKIMALHQQVIWQASCDDEAKDIYAIFGKHINVVVAPDIAVSRDENATQRLPKKCGDLHLVFLSRISTIKNLDYALSSVLRLKGNVHFDIYGPVEDEDYWNLCKALISKLPDNVAVSYNGPLPPEEVFQTFSKYHAFLFPTQGENFGHVIVESLAAGCLVVTSDRTPWGDLQGAGAGWALSLDDITRFHSVLQELITWDEAEFIERSKAACRYASEVAFNGNAVRLNRYLFCGRY